MIGIGRVRFPFIVFADHGGRRREWERGLWGSRTILGREPVEAEREHREESEGQADQHGDIEGGIHGAS